MKTICTKQIKLVEVQLKYSDAININVMLELKYISCILRLKNWDLIVFSIYCVQNLFAQQSGEFSEKMMATSQAALSPTEGGEKPHTLEEYSYDHFR